jgi:hypothetical protein
VNTALDRRPLQAVLLLLGGAALYLYALLEALGLQLRLPAPAFLGRLIAAKEARFWAWDQSTHLFAVLAVSAPFGWLLSSLFRRRLLVAAIVVVAPAVCWMVVDYFSLASTLPDVPPALNLFYAIGVVEVAVVLPALTLLLRRRSAG